MRDYLVGLKESFLNMIKDTKWNLLFNVREGHPLRNSLLQEIRANELVIKGIDAALAGGSFETIIEGFAKLLEAIDARVSVVPFKEVREGLFEYRAAMLTLRARFVEAQEGYDRQESFLENDDADEEPVIH